MNLNNREISKSDDDINLRISPMISRVASDNIINLEKRSVENLSKQLLFKEEKLQQAALYGMSLFTQLEEEKELCSKYMQLYDQNKLEIENLRQKLDESRNKLKDIKNHLHNEIETLNERIINVESENRMLKTTRGRNIVSPKVVNNRNNDINEDLTQLKMELEAKSKLKIDRMKKMYDEQMKIIKESKERAENVLLDERETHNALVNKLQNELNIEKNKVLNYESMPDYKSMLDKLQKTVIQERHNRMEMTKKLQQMNIALKDAIDQRWIPENYKKKYVQLKNVHAQILMEKQKLDIALQDSMNNKFINTPTSSIYDEGKSPLISSSYQSSSRPHRTIRTLRHQIRCLVIEVKQAHEHIEELKKYHMNAQLKYEERLEKLMAEKNQTNKTPKSVETTTSTPSSTTSLNQFQSFVPARFQTSSSDMFSNDPLQNAFRLLQFIRFHPARNRLRQK